MQTHTSTDRRRYLTFDGVISLIVAAGSTAAAVFCWQKWSITGDSMLGFAMFWLGAICITALRDFWEGDEPPTVHVDPDEFVEIVLANRAADESQREAGSPRPASQAQPGPDALPNTS